MKKEEKQNWRRLSPIKLQAELAKKRRELALALMKAGRGQLKNYRQLRELRYQLAVLATYLHEKELLARLKGEKNGRNEKEK